MTGPAIACHAATKKFGDFAAVDAIDLTVEQGEAFGFVGPNGAGKTTLMRLLLGFLRPTSGQTSIFGHDSWREQVAVHRLVGNLPGDFTYDDQMTGAELLAHVARLRGIGSGDPAHAYARELAEHLRADLGKSLRSLSRGNLQKIGLIQALFHRPRLLLLDEPTTGLDPLMQGRFIELVADARANGATVFLSSHNLREVEHVCERVSIIRHGQLVATEQVAELADRALRRVRIRFTGDVPRTALEALPGATQFESGPGGAVHFKMSGDVDRLIAVLGDNPVADLEIERATLDDLFATYYADAGEATEGVAPAGGMPQRAEAGRGGGAGRSGEAGE